MDATVSVSKGVFAVKGSLLKNKRKTKEKLPLFEQCFTNESWYKTFKKCWNDIEQSLKHHNSKTYNNILNDVVAYIGQCYDGYETDIFENLVPSAALLTGVNQPDHLQQFEALTDKIRAEATPHIAIVNSQDATSIRHLVESAVHQIVSFNDEEMDLSLDADDSMDSPNKRSKIRKSQCTMGMLKEWYIERYNLENIESLSPRKKIKLITKIKPIVIIIPDFESFNCEVLQDFVTIVSSYTCTLPVTLVFGVATSVSALHKSFPYHVSSKLLIKVFQSHSSTAYLNQVLEEVFLTPSCPFHLSGRAFELFTDVFLFYDFSVTGFTRSIKYCMMEHYYGDNIKSLCCDKKQLSSSLSQLTREDLDQVRRLMSFRPHVESQDCRARIALLTDDEYLRTDLEKCLRRYHEYLYNFHVVLRVLHVFVSDLPKNLLGKQIRELYVKCTSLESVTSTNEFKECIQLLKFQSKPQLIEKVSSCVKILASTQETKAVKKLAMSPLKNSPSKANKRVALNEDKKHTDMFSAKVELTTFLSQIEGASNNASTKNTENESEHKPIMNRLSLKESLLKAAKKERVQTEYELVRARLTDYLVELFGRYLTPPTHQPFHELFLFDDVASVKKQIVGAPRGAIHTALNNPVAYLQCSCCELATPGSLGGGLPDLCVAYKLHREAGRLVNLYDWLQAFAAVGAPDERDEEERRDVPADVQARFARAVAELQFLGFIKSSKRKTDHVTRLTW